VKPQRALFLTANAMLVAVAMLCGHCADDRPSQLRCAEPAMKAQGIVVAGSGAAVPLFADLAMRYFEKTGQRVFVPASIGTGGAIRALSDGAIHIGLATRPLKENERQPGVREIPFARTVLAVAVRRDGSARPLDMQTIGRIFSGEMRRWPDGTPAVPLQREPGDSGFAVLAGAEPGLFARIREGREHPGRRFCYSDDEVMDALGQIPGALGIVDEGMVRVMDAPFHLTRLPGARRTLFLLVKGTPTSEVRGFLNWLGSAEVDRRLQDVGYEPMKGNR